MSARVSLLIRALFIAGAGIALLLVGLEQANATVQEIAGGDAAAQDGSGGEEPIIQAGERISIPFGFNGALRLTDDNGSVVATGEGGCTADNEITIVFTVTQATSAQSIGGVWNGICTGQRQTWTNTPAATPSPNFVAGPAEACAFAETRDEEGVTDTQAWCDPVLLTSDYVYLPLILKP